MTCPSVPTFKTSRLLLVPLKIEDAAGYEKKFAVYDVVKALSHRVPWPYPEGGAKKFFEEFILTQQGKTLWAWGIFLKSRPEEIIGSI